MKRAFQSAPLGSSQWYGNFGRHIDFWVCKIWLFSHHFIVTDPLPLYHLCKTWLSTYSTSSGTSMLQIIWLVLADTMWPVDRELRIQTKNWRKFRQEKNQVNFGNDGKRMRSKDRKLKTGKDRKLKRWEEILTWAVPLNPTKQFCKIGVISKPSNNGSECDGNNHCD